MKQIIVIPSGGGIKNFLSTRFLDLLLERGNVVIWHSLPEWSIEGLRGRWGDRVQWKALPAYSETLSERLWRQAKAHAQIHWRGNGQKEILLERVRSGGPWWNRCLGFVASGIGWECASGDRIGRLDWLHERAAARSVRTVPFHSFLEKQNPDVVFCTYQRAIRAVPVMAAARALGIPTCTFIYSWDNLPKNRITVPSDYFFVWSQSMKEELLGYYPRVIPDRVRVVGTPQFEHYANTTLLRPREEFLGSLGLDPGKRVVCFSGDDVKTSPHDPMYLADLARAIRGLPAGKRPQLLFRPCPTDQSSRFDDVLKSFPEIVRSAPLWTAPTERSDWSQVIPAKEDIALLVNVVFHCDAVVNVGSTMAMDFAVFDKPGIYVAYNPPVANGCWDIETIYRLPHFDSVHQFQPVYWARSAQDLSEVVWRALHCPAEKSAARQAWLRYHVQLPLDRASHRFSEALREIGTSRQRVETRQTREI